MKYRQDYRSPSNYFKGSDTSVAESEPKSIQDVIPSPDLPLDTSSYQSIEKSLSKSDREDLQALTFPLDTSHYKKSFVRKITYRVTKK